MMASSSSSSASSSSIKQESSFAAPVSASINHPVFTTVNDADDKSMNDAEYGFLSEYLMEDTNARESGHKDDDDDEDVSDEEDLSSGDEGDGKKRRLDDRPKTKDQIDRRRERNRVLARKTRLRKKFFFESLQRQVAQLAMENDMLKGIVKHRMGPDVKDQVLAGCASETNPVLAATASQATSLLEKADFGLMAAIQAAQRSFVISDPSLPDNPIIFASKGFLELSGYSLEAVLGHNCRFLQGPGTDPLQLEVLRNGIMAGEDTSVCVLNYRADGTPFYNQIFVAALRDADGKIINYVGVQVEIKPPVSDRLHQDDPLGLGKAPKKGRPRTRDVKEGKEGKEGKRGGALAGDDDDGKPKKAPRKAKAVATKPSLTEADRSAQKSSSSSSSGASHARAQHRAQLQNAADLDASLATFQMPSISQGMEDLFFLFEDNGQDRGQFPQDQDPGNTFNFGDTGDGAGGGGDGDGDGGDGGGCDTNWNFS